MNKYFYLSELKNRINNNKIVVDAMIEGRWKNPKYGLIEASVSKFKNFIENWKQKTIGRDIGLDFNHQSGKSAGWVTNLFIEQDEAGKNKLRAEIELTPVGKQAIESKEYRYISPEFTDSYRDKETGVDKKNCILNLALTNKPFLSMNPVLMSEDLEKSYGDTLTFQLKADAEYQEYKNKKEESVNMSDVFMSTLELCESILQEKHKSSELPARLAELAEMVTFLDDESERDSKLLKMMLSQVYNKYSITLEDEINQPEEMTPKEVQEYATEHGMELVDAYDRLVREDKVKI
jgi:phage I-like protein